jgi:hypothetical protein
MENLKIDPKKFWKRQGKKSTHGKGQRYRNRVIALTFPAEIEGHFFVPDDEFQVDTSGPPDWLDQMDTSGPDQMDNSGPPNLEENLEYNKGRRSK